MNKLKVVFIGIGSIAKRHIKNLVSVCESKKIELIIDAVRSGHGKMLPKEISSLVNNVYYETEPINENYDVVFITNPTSRHLKTILTYQDKARHFFIEKPFIDRTQLSGFNSNDIHIKGIAYVACPLRYTNVVQYLKRNLDLKSVYSVRAISSSYLPEWRPGQDYRQTYSAHKEQGGGVSIDLIHEWDYLNYLFGKPKEVYSIISRVSHLEIDSDDIAVYIARYKDMVAELHLDYLGRKTIREIEVFSKDETIIGDLINSQIKFLCSGKVIDLAEDRDSYQKKELDYFISLISKFDNKEEVPQYNNLSTAVSTLKLTMGDI